MGYAIETLKAYDEQVRGLFTSGSVTVRPEEFEVLNKNFPGLTNEAQLLYVEGGLFSSCCTEKPVMNLTINPQRALGNAIPVIRRNTQVSKYAFLTDIAEPTGTLPNAPCDDAPTIGDISACFMETRKGRLSLSTKTLELDRIIQRYCEGITTDLYVVGDVRGVSAGIGEGMQGNLSLMAEGAVMRQMQLLARALQQKLLRQFWTGDPTNAALNTAGGGERQFWGLEHLIAADYGTAAKPWVTGTDCDKLNSDIKDFGNTCVGAANATTGVGLYEYLQMVEQTVTTRASFYGYTNVEWVLVMRPEMWSAITKYLPCEMLSGNCSTAVNLGGGTSPLAGNVSIDVSGMGIATVRQQLQSSQRLSLNGTDYRVIVDDSLPVVTVAGPPASQTSDIYFIPLRVEGQPVLFWDSANYMAIDRALRPLPNGVVKGWHDVSMYSVIEQRNFCISILTKTENGLVMLAPHLAARIENVRACQIQPVETWQ